MNDEERKTTALDLVTMSTFEQLGKLIEALKELKIESEVK